MAGSLNRVMLIGNLGDAPEIKSFQNGGRVCNLRIATSEIWKDKNTGERKERTEWHTVAIFSEGLVGVAERYLKKGSKVFVEGKLQTRKWQDQSGNDRYSTEVVIQGMGGTLTMLDGAAGNDRGEQRKPYDVPDQQNHLNDPHPNKADGGGWGGGYDDLDSDLPF
jgi:single-strand DNA-binding protein